MSQWVISELFILCRFIHCFPTPYPADMIDYVSQYPYIDASIELSMSRLLCLILLLEDMDKEVSESETFPIMYRRCQLLICTIS